MEEMVFAVLNETPIREGMLVEDMEWFFKIFEFLSSLILK